MKNTDLYRAIGEIDESILKKTDKFRKKTKHKWKWLSVPLAACLCIGVLLLALLPMNVGADFTIEDGILLAYTGRDERVILPDSVTAIADYAFSAAPQVIEITLSENVCSVASCAFYGCDKLSNIVIAEDNNHFIRENDAVLSTDRTLLVRYFGTGDIYRIPESVKFLSAQAFSGSGVRQVILHDKIRFIGRDCFSGTAYELPMTTDELNRVCLKQDGLLLYALKDTDIGCLFGNRYEYVSVCDDIVTAYEWNDENNSVTIYRFGAAGNYYQVLNFTPVLTGIGDTGAVGGFRSELNGMIAFDSGVKINYDQNGNPYVITDSTADYAGYALITDIYLTHDGGLTWTRLPTNPPLRDQKEHIVSAGFLSETVSYLGIGICYGQDPVVWMTFDSGNSWQKIKMEIPPEILNGGAAQLIGMKVENGIYIAEVEIHSEDGYRYVRLRSTDGILWQIET